jgi:hypothetical protein
MKTKTVQSTKSKVQSPRSKVQRPRYQRAAFNCGVPVRRIERGQKLCVVLVSQEEMQAVHRFLRVAALLPRVDIGQALAPLMQGLARSWLIG